MLENVQTTDKVWQREVFGPICTIKKFDDFKEAINLVNQSEFGLQTGVYTSDVQKIFYSFEVSSFFALFCVQFLNGNLGKEIGSWRSGNK